MQKHRKGVFVWLNAGIMHQIVILGKVLRGKGYGRTIGFPTINLDRKQFARLKEKPPLGIYVGRVILGAKQYRAGIVIGPIDRRGLPKIEAHLIGFKGDAYGKKASLEIGKFIRNFTKFTVEKELIAQIKKDLSHVYRNY